MLIQNITFSIEQTIEQDFTAFLKGVVLEIVKKTTDSKPILFRLLTEVENGYINFPLQVSFTDAEAFFKFEEETIPLLIDTLNSKFLNQYYFFVTTLEKIGD